MQCVREHVAKELNSCRVQCVSGAHSGWLCARVGLSLQPYRLPCIVTIYYSPDN